MDFLIRLNIVYFKQHSAHSSSLCIQQFNYESIGID